MVVRNALYSGVFPHIAHRAGKVNEEDLVAVCSTSSFDLASSFNETILKKQHVIRNKRVGMKDEIEEVENEL